MDKSRNVHNSQAKQATQSQQATQDNQAKQTSQATSTKQTKQGFSWKNDTWVKPYLGRYKKTLLLALTLGCATIIFASALMFTSGWLIGGSAEMPYSILLLGTPLLCVRIFGVGKPVLQYIERLTSHDWVLRMTSNLRVKLYRAFDVQGISFHSIYRLGDALGLLAEDIGHVQNLYLRTIFPSVIAWVIGLLLVVLFGYFTWWMAIAVGVVLLFELLVVPGISVAINGMRQTKHKSLKSELYATATDNVMGITDWILSGREEDFLTQSQQIQDKLRKLEAHAHAFDRKRDLALQALFALGALLVLVWAALQFGDTQGGESNWILAFVLGYFPLLDVFGLLSDAAVEARSHQDAIERLNNLPEVEVDGTSTHVVDILPQEPLDITLKHVNFHYPQTQNSLLHDITLTIPQGQKIAILGKSGGGKSTLASLIRGDLAPTSGTITLGGTPCIHLAEADQASCYFGVIQQTTYLFNTTLRENLLLANKDADDELLLETLSRVGLDKMMSHLPEGLNTVVDEAGFRFSGGERHRIALARVLLQNVPIVILDEPMVGLDPATENRVLSTIFDVLADKTLIMITHHLQGVSAMNRVLFLDKGRITLDGAPEHLEQTSKHYRHLIALDRGATNSLLLGQSY